jgi:hypothetical protein
MRSRSKQEVECEWNGGDGVIAGGIWALNVADLIPLALASTLAEVHIKDRLVPTEWPSLLSHRARMGKTPTMM